MARPRGAIAVQRLQGVELNWNEINVRKSPHLSLSLSLSVSLSLFCSLFVSKSSLSQNKVEKHTESRIYCVKHSVLCRSWLSVILFFVCDCVPCFHLKFPPKRRSETPPETKKYPPKLKCLFLFLSLCVFLCVVLCLNYFPNFVYDFYDLFTLIMNEKNSKKTKNHKHFLK